MTIETKDVDKPSAPSGAPGEASVNEAFVPAVAAGGRETEQPTKDDVKIDQDNENQLEKTSTAWLCCAV
jgi:hypothetical protein